MKCLHHWFKHCQLHFAPILHSYPTVKCLFQKQKEERGKKQFIAIASLVASFFQHHFLLSNIFSSKTQFRMKVISFLKLLHKLKATNDFLGFCFLHWARIIIKASLNKSWIRPLSFHFSSFLILFSYFVLSFVTEQICSTSNIQTFLSFFLYLSFLLSIKTWLREREREREKNWIE